jgi:hypothetical protein
VASTSPLEFDVPVDLRSSAEFNPLQKLLHSRIASFFLLLGVFSFGLVACQSASSDRSSDAHPTSPEASVASAPFRATASTQDRYDLARDEKRGGHTLQKHVGRTDDELRERLRRERNISAASTWTDRAAAEETVAAALRADHAKIDRWIDRGYPRANLALHFDAGRNIGRGIEHGESTSVPCTSAVVVLKADSLTSFFVLTTYPEARYGDSRE